MSLRRTLDVIATTVERASSVPLSASCLVNRAEVLSLVERARSELPAELDEAAALLVAHHDVIAEAEREGEAILARARSRAEQLVNGNVLVVTAHARSEQILDAARIEAARLLREADDYCDRRLAAFEGDLDRALAQVRRGRDRLRERSNLEPGESAAEDQPLITAADEEPFDGMADERIPVEVGAGAHSEYLDLAGMERAGLGRA